MKENLKFKKSYSQCGEDRIIDFLFRAMKVSKPSYIDIGAFDPFKDSNTALFYEDSSRGINIEPDSEKFKKFLIERPCDINLNIGISEKNGSAELFKISSGKMSTIKKERAEELVLTENKKISGKEKIELKNINEIIEKYCNGVFPDFLSIDTEGTDLEILKSINWEKSSPLIICAETASYSTNGNEEKDKELISCLEGKGYLVYADTRINTIFVKKEKYVNHI